MWCKAGLAAKSGLGAGVLLTDTHNERGLSVDHGGGGAESSDFRVQEVMRSERGA